MAVGGGMAEKGQDPPEAHKSALIQPPSAFIPAPGCNDWTLEPALRPSSMLLSGSLCSGDLHFAEQNEITEGFKAEVHYSLWARLGPLPVFVSKVLLEHSHTIHLHLV